MNSTNKAPACLCPYCKVSLQGRALERKPLPGQRRWLPMYAAPVCPDCGGFLQQRGGAHPMDRMVPWVALPALLPAAAQLWPSARGVLLVLSFAAFLVLVVSMLYLTIQYKRTPIYFERYDRSARPF